MNSIMLRLLSVGMIGGADGPTAVYVTSTINWPYIIAGIAGIAVIAVIVLIVGIVKKAKR